MGIQVSFEIHLARLKPGSHCAILATIWSSEINLENPKIPIILG